MNHRHGLCNSADAGITLVELMATMVVAGILSGIAFSSFVQPWQRQRIDSAAKELTAWLEERRIQAIQTSSNCIISINASQAQLAAASDNSCGEFGLLDLRNSTTNSQSLKLKSKDGTNDVDELLFTPRGTSTPRGTRSPRPTHDELLLSIEGESRERCIQVTYPLGLIRLGRRFSDSDACDYTTAH